MTDLRRRALVLLALFLGTVAVLGSCASIPHSGPVGSIAPDGQNEESNTYTFDAIGPRAGASPQEVIEGFYQAGIAAQDDFKVAREFLTPEAAGTWKGSVSTRVYDAAPSVVTGSKTGDYSIQFEMLSTVDEHGVMTRQPANTSQALPLSLLKVDNEWRISRVPDGTLLEQSNFSVQFSAHSIYFYDPGFHYAVPDIRWFPKRAGLPASMVEAILAGPAPYLKNAVVSAFSEGSSLVRSSVPVESNKAVVDLTPLSFSDASDTTRHLMQQQLELTLTQVGAVRDVVMTEDQREVKLGVPGAGFVPAEINPSVPDTQIAISNNMLVYYQGNSVVPVGGVQDISAYGPIYPAMSPSGNRYAFLNASRSKLVAVNDKGNAQVVATGTDLVPPSLDASGWTWTVDHGAPTQVLAVPADIAKDGRVRPIAAEWLKDSHVSSLRVSRDGTRAVIVAKHGDTVSVNISGILRDSEGFPRGFAKPMRLYPSVPVSRAVWDSDSSVIVMQADADAPVTAERITLSGGSKEFLPLLGMTGLSAGAGERRWVYAETPDGIYSRTGNTWHEQDGKARYLSYPG
ncbi:LpqB family beta-propeller domain-containing protein [Paeniglutamicibacter cryotolerans]|uniref:GerMN domain-containing protein n=1 Tax=Paeniglutamicibacter cryotolerans TaxID=670079 RepID=A0A839QPN9_9MICC|nr:LpqB family beta-propeller domain-containing protein [Paeniglutamicibacter cryotolerans]MBB2996605.1 hypothetical protein [Paeniglutamicibacter cryotolerans]